MENNEFLKKASELRRKYAQASLWNFANVYLKHHITTLASAGHLEIYTYLLMMLEERGKKLAFAAPREFGKSTLITLIFLIYCICYKKEEFIVIISNTAGQSIKILENLKQELVDNNLLKMDFPEIFESAGMPKPPRWTQANIITRNNIEVLALGYGQQIRGRKHGFHRPSLVILDDVESGENTFSLETKDKMKAWLKKSVLKVGSKITNYLFIGNIFNSFCLLGEVIKKLNEFQSWNTKTYRALEHHPKREDLWQKCWNIRTGNEQYNAKNGPDVSRQYYLDHRQEMDEGAELLWPERWSLYELMMQQNEDSVSFASEMQNEPLDRTELSLDVENFKYWTDRYPDIDALLAFLGKNVQFYCACDPSMGEDAVKGDYSAIVILAYKDKVFYIIEADIARRRTDRFIQDILAYAERYPFNLLAFETNGFQGLSLKQLEEKAFEANIPMRYVPIKNTRDKLARIQAIQGWFKNGYIQFSRNHKVLLGECLQYPDCRHDDGLDALEMGIRAAKEQGLQTVSDYTESLKKHNGVQLPEKYDLIKDILGKALRGNWGYGMGI